MMSSSGGDVQSGRGRGKNFDSTTEFHHIPACVECIFGFDPGGETSCSDIHDREPLEFLALQQWIELTTYSHRVNTTTTTELIKYDNGHHLSKYKYPTKCTVHAKKKDVFKIND